MWVIFAWSTFGLTFGDLLVSYKLYSLIDQYHSNIYSLTRPHPLVGRMESNCPLSVRCSCLNPIRRNSIRRFNCLAAVWYSHKSCANVVNCLNRLSSSVRMGFQEKALSFKKKKEMKWRRIILTDIVKLSFLFLCRLSGCWYNWLTVFNVLSLALLFLRSWIDVVW